MESCWTPALSYRQLQGLCVYASFTLSNLLYGERGGTVGVKSFLCMPLGKAVNPEFVSAPLKSKGTNTLNSLNIAFI